jgi:hypothetical protein
MHELVSFFGPKATLFTVILCFIIAPIAIWHHVYLVIHIWKNWREEEKLKDQDEHD